MIDSSTILMLAIVIVIGYIGDVTGPQPHHYKGGIVIVDKKYQCPTYCGIDHNHSVYYEGQSVGMVIDSTKLGKRYKPPKKK